MVSGGIHFIYQVLGPVESLEAPHRSINLLQKFPPTVKITIYKPVKYTLILSLSMFLTKGGRGSTNLKKITWIYILYCILKSR